MAQYITLAARFNVSINPSVLNNSEQLRWDAGGVVITGMYLQYCEGIKTGFVAALNARMEKEWKEDFIEESRLTQQSSHPAAITNQIKNKCISDNSRDKDQHRLVSTKNQLF